jgi:hypothetical protein
MRARLAKLCTCNLSPLQACARTLYEHAIEAVDICIPFRHDSTLSQTFLPSLLLAMKRTFFEHSLQDELALRGSGWVADVDPALLFDVLLHAVDDVEQICGLNVSLAISEYSLDVAAVGDRDPN